jgi:hypothetical protein
MMTSNLPAAGLLVLLPLLFCLLGGYAAVVLPGEKLGPVTAGVLLLMHRLLQKRPAAH